MKSCNGMTAVIDDDYKIQVTDYGTDVVDPKVCAKIEKHVASYFQRRECSYYNPMKYTVCNIRNVFYKVNDSTTWSAFMIDNDEYQVLDDF